MEIMKKAFYKNDDKEPFMSVKVESDIRANISTVTITKNGSEETCIIPYMNLAHTSDIRLIDTGKISYVLFITGRLSEKIIVVDTCAMEHTVSAFANLTNIKINSVRINNGIVQIEVAGKLFNVDDGHIPRKSNVNVTFASDAHAEVCTMFTSNMYHVTGTDGRGFTAPIVSSIGKISKSGDGRGKFVPITPPVSISKSPNNLGLKVDIGNNIGCNICNQNSVRVSDLQYGYSFEISVENCINDVDVDTMKTFVGFGGYRYIVFANGEDSNYLTVVNIDKKRGLSYSFDSISDFNIVDVYRAPSENGIGKIFIEGISTISAATADGKTREIHDVEFNFYLDDNDLENAHCNINDFVFDNDRIRSEGCSLEDYKIAATASTVRIVTDTSDSPFIYIDEEDEKKQREGRNECTNDCCDCHNETNFDKLRYIAGDVMEHIDIDILRGAGRLETKEETNSASDNDDEMEVLSVTENAFFKEFNELMDKISSHVLSYGASINMSSNDRIKVCSFINSINEVMEKYNKSEKQ